MKHSTNKKIIVLLQVVVALLLAVQPVVAGTQTGNDTHTLSVCTFIGKGEDVVHRLTIPGNGKVTIRTPAGENIQKIIYSNEKFQVDHSQDEVIISPQRAATIHRSSSRYSPDNIVTIITDQGYTYSFEIETQSTGEGKKEKHPGTGIDRDIIIIITR